MATALLAAIAPVCWLGSRPGVGGARKVELPLTPEPRAKAVGGSFAIAGRRWVRGSRRERQEPPQHTPAGPASAAVTAATGACPAPAAAVDPDLKRTAAAADPACHGPLSPILPETIAPILLLDGRSSPPLVIALLGGGTGGTDGAGPVAGADGSQEISVPRLYHNPVTRSVPAR